MHSVRGHKMGWGLGLGANKSRQWAWTGFQHPAAAPLRQSRGWGRGWIPFTRPRLSRRGFRRGRSSHGPRGPGMSHEGDRPRWDTRGTECTAPGSKSMAVLRPRRLRRRRKIAPRLQPIDRHRSKIIALSEGCRQRYKTATTERQRCMPAVKILPCNSDFIGLPEK